MFPIITFMMLLFLGKFNNPYIWVYSKFSTSIPLSTAEALSILIISNCVFILLNNNLWTHFTVCIILLLIFGLQHLIVLKSWFWWGLIKCELYLMYISIFLQMTFSSRLFMSIQTPWNIFVSSSWNVMNFLIWSLPL